MQHVMGVDELDSYDCVIVAFSGGKDSVACVLALLEQGVAVEKLELWHHLVDGREAVKLQMDWPCSEAYCEAFASHIGVPLYFTWKVGGFEGEMLRQDARTRPICFEVPVAGGGVEVRSTGGKGGKLATRRAFPQVSADLSVRWCSALMLAP